MKYHGYDGLGIDSAAFMQVCGNIQKLLARCYEKSRSFLGLKCKARDRWVTITRSYCITRQQKLLQIGWNGFHL